MTALAIVDQTIGNIEAELCLIAAMLYEPRIAEDLAERVSIDDFSDKFIGHIFSLIIRENSLGRLATPITIYPYLKDEPAFQEAGGRAWLAGLVNCAATLVVARDAAAQVVELAQRRRLMEGLKQTLLMGDDYERPVAELIEAADEAICVARNANESRGEYSASQCLRLVVDGFDDPVRGVRCGVIEPIDRLLGPLRPKHLTIGAGRPGMGKSATAISYVLGASGNGHGTLFFSLEMGADDIAERMAADLCLEHRIPHELIRDRRLNAEQKRHVCRAMAAIEELPLQIIDRAGLTLNQLRVSVRRWKRRFAARGRKLELVVVDYLQLMRGQGKDRYEQITNISAGLKEIAKQEEVHVFALAQLSRKVEERADKRPLMADLRESGQIEQDADAILFFLRDEYYLRLNEPAEDHASRAKWEEALQRCQGRIEFICAKRRHGSTGSLTGDFLYHYQAVRG